MTITYCCLQLPDIIAEDAAISLSQLEDLMEDDTGGPVVHSGDPMLSSPHLAPLSPPTQACHHPLLPDEDTLGSLAPTTSNSSSDMDIVA